MKEACPCKDEGLRQKCGERTGGWSRAGMHKLTARKGLTHTEETPLTHKSRKIFWIPTKKIKSDIAIASETKGDRK